MVKILTNLVLYDIYTPSSLPTTLIVLLGCRHIYLHGGAKWPFFHTYSRSMLVFVFVLQSGA